MEKQTKVTVKIVSLKEPCTACIILDGLLKETLTKLQKEYSGFDLDLIELDNLKQAASVPGLEVEKLPAVLVNNEQVTAGSLPSKELLITMIQAGGG